ncbi:MAG: YfhL family 4Fe-4S dicluster ferredoxin [Deltaproteobacteria bacterium]|nr:YfhL family 4Fe-4S dicluster ferredoxin [Deltaproteobacteria bacterium]MBW2398622.1 YfhL family 4Fe-4S dicluster ferredoxin [Deltaproteobacteria bacterium]
MATRITEDCINCGACEDECPNGAISMGAEIFAIDPQLCTECVGFSNEQKCAAACPPDVCLQDPDRIENEAALFARARKIHPDKAESLSLDASTSHFRANGG